MFSHLDKAPSFHFLHAQRLPTLWRFLVQTLIYQRLETAIYQGFGIPLHQPLQIHIYQRIQIPIYQRLRTSIIQGPNINLWGTSAHIFPSIQHYLLRTHMHLCPNIGTLRVSHGEMVAMKRAQNHFARLTLEDYR